MSHLVLLSLVLVQTVASPTEYHQHVTALSTLAYTEKISQSVQLCVLPFNRVTCSLTHVYLWHMKSVSSASTSAWPSLHWVFSKRGLLLNVGSCKLAHNEIKRVDGENSQLKWHATFVQRQYLDEGVTHIVIHFQNRGHISCQRTEES